MICDLDALLLGVGPGHTPEALVERIESLPREQVVRRTEGLQRMFERRVRVRFDGDAARFQVSFPERRARGEESASPSLLGTVARLEGAIPEAAESVTFWASRSFPAIHLSLVWDGANVSRRELLSRAEESAAYPIAPPLPPPSTLGIAWQYSRLGFTHILPHGLDHILFVLGLFLLSLRLRPLLWQVTAFTVAHSLTLALSIYGLVSLPGAVVEPLIALSIAYVAVENLLVRDCKPWRVAVVFGFGLLHGLGFAGVLGQLGLPEGEFLMALLTFNLGVELGQLSVLGLALLAVGWFRDRPWYRNLIVIPASCLIGAVGLYLVAVRVIGPTAPKEVAMLEAQPVTTAEEVASLLEASKEKPVFIFKHSLTCSISTAAWDEYQRFVEAAPQQVLCTLVEIQKAREASNQVAATTGIRHESPQAILLRDGEAVWHASHWSVTVKSLNQALSEQGVDVEASAGFDEGG